MVSAPAGPPLSHTGAPQIVSNVVHMLGKSVCARAFSCGDRRGWTQFSTTGASVLAFCFARRMEGERLFSVRGWAELSWARFLILGIFLDSCVLFTS